MMSSTCESSILPRRELVLIEWICDCHVNDVLFVFVPEDDVWSLVVFAAHVPYLSFHIEPGSSQPAGEVLRDQMVSHIGATVADDGAGERMEAVRVIGLDLATEAGGWQVGIGVQTQSIASRMSNSYIGHSSGLGHSRPPEATCGILCRLCSSGRVVEGWCPR